MKCRLCGDPLDLDQSPNEGGYGLNPSTLRMGWMHQYCEQVALENLTPERLEAYEAIEVPEVV